MTDRPKGQGLNELLAVCSDKQSGTTAAARPASDAEILALERHWHMSLPAPYRRLLRRHNGIPRLWFDLELLSTGAILGSAREPRAPAVAAPQDEQRIFARGTESRDALAFEPSVTGGEPAVVHLNHNRVVARWPALAALLTELHNRLFIGFRGCGATTEYLWTGLWTYWPWDGSPHCRAFTRGPRGVYAGREGLFRPDPDRGDIDHTRLLPEEALAEADRRFAHGLRRFGDSECRMAVVLTERPAEPCAKACYVYYEPCADFVVALSTTERAAQVSATYNFWDEPWRPSIVAIKTTASELMTQGRVADALLYSIDASCALIWRLQSARRPP